MNITCKIRNFTAFGDDVSIIPLSTPGLTLIRGKNLSSTSKTSNGSGKSQILKAIEWGLYGVVPTGLVKANLVNSQIGKNGCVETTITAQDRVGVVTRYISDSKHKNSLFFTINGEDYRGATDKQTQERIEEFLGLDHASFMTAVLFTMDEVDSFAGATPSNQDKVFTNLLRLDVFTQAAKLVSDKTKELSNMETTLVIDIDKLTSREVDLNHAIITEEKLLDTWRYNQNRLISNSKSLIQNLTEKHKSVTDSLHQEESALTQVTKTIDSLKRQLSGLDKTKLEHELEKWTEESNECNASRLQAEQEVRTYVSLIHDAQSLHGVARCDKCGSKLTGKQIYGYIEELNLAMQTAKERGLLLLEESVRLSGLIAKGRDNINSITHHENELIQRESECRSYRFRIEAYKEQLLSIETEKIKQEKQLSVLEEEEPPTSVDTAELKVTLQEVQELLAGKNKELTSTKYLLELYQFWKVGFGSSGIRNMLVRNIIPELNQIAARYSSILTNGELQIIFDAETELASGETRNKLEVKVQDKYGSESYHSSSGGEKRRIDLCVNLALHSLVTRRIGIPFVFMDEVFVKLDTRGIEYVQALLRELTNEIPSIFIISNQDEITSDEYDQVWTVERVGKTSKLYLEER